MPAPADLTSSLRVALDATPLLGQPTGVAVFTSSLLGALGSDDSLSLSAFAVSWRRRHGLAERVPLGVSVKQHAMPARPLTWAWARSSHPRLERFIGPVDVVHGTNFTVPPARHAAEVVTVHDLTCVRFPELCQPRTLEYPRLIQRALRRGAIVHAPSRFVAEEVRQHFTARGDQVVAIHSGVPSLPPADERLLDELVGGRAPYVLSVGTAEPRKDLPGLVEAFDAVAATNSEIQLVLAGPPGWGQGDLDEALERCHARDRVLQLGFVSDEALSSLLAGARVLCYPSLYEGFGFPPLQAMAAGVPVVATRAGALSETIGGASLMVEPRDLDALGEALAVAIEDEAQRSVLISAGHARVKDFTWEATGRSMAALYRRVSDQR